MPPKPKVAVLFTSPETVLQDYGKWFDLAGGCSALPAGTPTILKDNKYHLAARGHHPGAARRRDQ